MKDGSCATLGTGKAVRHLEKSRAVLEAIVERITLAQMQRREFRVSCAHKTPNGDGVSL